MAVEDGDEEDVDAASYCRVSAWNPLFVVVAVRDAVERSKRRFDPVIYAPCALVSRRLAPRRRGAAELPKIPTSQTYTHTQADRHANKIRKSCNCEGIVKSGIERSPNDFYG